MFACEFAWHARLAWSACFQFMRVHDSSVQDLTGCAASKRANGSLAVSSRGDGWAFICSEKIPFNVVFKSNEHASHLHIRGHIARIDAEVAMTGPCLHFLAMHVHAHEFA